MTRPWCAGEMLTAFSNDVNIVVVHCSDHLPLTDDDLNNSVKLLGIGTFRSGFSESFLSAWRGVSIPAEVSTVKAERRK